MRCIEAGIYTEDFHSQRPDQPNYVYHAEIYIYSRGGEVPVERERVELGRS